ncbi:hypothetical protein CC86DRAFT_368549 [Ophiobolus disseminans]|uniref:Uncharacterized protein n=1 Tax=Ophiobolus disseminans TaxID=1469910 RepID=A0A6A7A8N4_9PLEO|nr:hypothetical protein CC86DRAFT_368549 [Ophiobolus disseminans]
MKSSLEALPEELLVAVFQYVFTSTTPIGHLRFEHKIRTPQDGMGIVKQDSLLQFVGTTKPLFRVAQEAFYENNTFLLHRAPSSHFPIHRAKYFHVPPKSVRPWISRLQITIIVPAPWHGMPGVCSTEFHVCHCRREERFTCPFSDWNFLKKIEAGYYEFPQLRHLHLQFVTPHRFGRSAIWYLGYDLIKRGRMSFRAERLTVESCIMVGIADTNGSALKEVVEGCMTVRK